MLASIGIRFIPPRISSAIPSKYVIKMFSDPNLVSMSWNGMKRIRNEMVIFAERVRQDQEKHHRKQGAYDQLSILTRCPIEDSRCQLHKMAQQTFHTPLFALIAIALVR